MEKINDKKEAYIYIKDVVNKKIEKNEELFECAKSFFPDGEFESTIFKDRFLVDDCFPSLAQQNDCECQH